MPAPFTYLNNIPQAADDPSTSQPQLLTNFASIQSLIEINHETFASNDAGKHKFVQMPRQGSDPTTLADEGAIYTKQGAFTAETEMYYRRQSNGAVIPMTEGQPGWTYLPSGLIIKYGTGNASGYAGAPVSFAAGADFTNVYGIFVNIIPAANNQLNANAIVTYAVGSLNIGAKTFQVNCFRLTDQAPASNINFYWMLLGY